MEMGGGEDGLAWDLTCLGNSIPPQGKERSQTLWRMGGHPFRGQPRQSVQPPRYSVSPTGDWAGNLIFAVQGRRWRANLQKRVELETLADWGQGL